MTTEYRDLSSFLVGIKLGNSAVGSGVASGSTGYSLTSFTSADRTLTASEATAANIAATLATLISDLGHRGVIKVTGGEG